jgi:hypothetical protein
MANYWAIAIGINQYQQVQPLNYAQRDAQSFRDFLVKEAGFSSKHCLLLTDAVTAGDRTETYPTRDTIQTRLSQVCQQLMQPDDVLWCFFSGCGVQINGKDYLMPVDGDLAEVETTGIPMEFLFNTFQAAPTDNIVLVLDVNRSQSVRAGEGLGRHTTALAQEHGIPALLSAMPNQFSHETLALRQGLFTAALIDGIRYQGCVTLEQLAQYLSDRLPELSEHHWRPRQDPLLVIPSGKKYQLIIPEKAAITLGVPPAPNVADRHQSHSAPNGMGYDNSAASANSQTANLSVFPGGGTAVPGSTMLLDKQSASHPGSSIATANATVSTAPTSALEHRSSTPVPATPDTAEPDSMEKVSDDLFRQRLLKWGGIMAIVLLLGVIIRNVGLFSADRVSKDSASPPPAPVLPSAPPVADSPSSSLNAPPTVQIEAGSPLAAIDAALQSRQYGEAKQLLDQVPADQRDSNYNILLEQTNRDLLIEARTILSRERNMTAENQASDFVDAIKKVRLIQSDQPFYEAAQQDIDRWSMVILDMAQGRAERDNGGDTPTAATNYSVAIATAGLVPSDRQEISDLAQKSIAKWSNDLLNLAKARATEGYLDLAIQTAELVPLNTEAYAPAQEAIANWRNQPIPVPPAASPAASPASP